MRVSGLNASKKREEPMSEQIFTSCTQGGPVFVYVKDGKIVRIRPLVFAESENVPTWTIEAGGKKFSAPRRVALSPVRVSTESEDLLGEQN